MPACPFLAPLLRRCLPASSGATCQRCRRDPGASPHPPPVRSPPGLVCSSLRSARRNASAPATELAGVCLAVCCGSELIREAHTCGLPEGLHARALPELRASQSVVVPVRGVGSFGGLPAWQKSRFLEWHVRWPRTKFGPLLERK